MWQLSQAVEVQGATSNYYVKRDRAIKLLDTGRATQISRSLIRLVGRSITRLVRKEWVKKRSGPVSVMQLVDTRKVRPRNKPRRLD